jgi:hypothetical protein
MITVILNGYKRLKFLNKQIQSIKEQTVQARDIIVWQNNAGQNSKNKIEIEKTVIHVNSSYNFGVWARFAVALNSKTEFVCVLDDDTIPGINWLKNCIDTIEKKNGLLGTRGVRFASKKEYIVGEEFGWNNPNNEVKQVDIVGHSWFFRRKWLSVFWRELPEIDTSIYVGEDIHFSYTLQKYLKLKTYVPPHPKNNKSFWGSNSALAMKIGTDINAISYNNIRTNEMDLCLRSYIKKGFQLNYLSRLKYKGIYLKTKKRIKKFLI